MSANFSSILPLDLGFKRKHKISQSQTILMAYLALLPNWAKDINGDEYFLIVTVKIIEDLNMGLKTIEANLKVLEDLNLIKRARTKVAEWSNEKNFRTVKITTKGKEYGLAYAKSKNSNSNLIEEWEIKYDNLEKINKKLVEENKTLKSQEISQETNQKTNIEENLESFKKRVTKEFEESCKPICNFVDNTDNWAKDSQFWINSYRKLTIKTPNGNFKQISNPEKITNFWKWLFENKQRCGDIIIEEKKEVEVEKKKKKEVIEKKGEVQIIPMIYHLLPFIGLMILLEGEKFLINKLEAILGGVRIVLQNVKNLKFTKPKIVDVGTLTNWIVKHREDFQRRELQNEMVKLYDLIGKTISFQNQKWKISGFRDLKEFKIGILVEKSVIFGKKPPRILTDNQRKNNPIIKFTPDKAREFIDYNNDYHPF